MKTVKIILIIGLIALFSACVPVDEPSDQPTEEPSDQPTEEPSEEVITEEPTEEPVDEPSEEVVVNELPPENVSVVDTSGFGEDFEYYMACDNNKIPFRMDEGLGEHGQFTFTGAISEDLEERPWGMDENDLVPVLRMWVEESDSPEAYAYFEDMASSGNTINILDGDKLGFRIGINENDEFSSSAVIADETLQAIFNSLESGEETSLTFTYALPLGMGAPENYSFACEIELAD